MIALAQADVETFRQGAKDTLFTAHLMLLTWIEPIPRRVWIRKHCIGSILDVASSSGENFLGSELPVAFLDINEFALPNFTQGDAANLPFTDGSYDTVVLGEILEHVARPARVLSEAVRVARQKVLVTVPNEHAWPQEARPMMGHAERMKQPDAQGLTPELLYLRDSPLCTRIITLAEAEHRRYFTEGSLKRLLSQSGLPFTIEEISSDGLAIFAAELQKSPLEK